MIIVKLMGGVGNQMFQYAAGRALACRLDTDLKIDISEYAAPLWKTPREYQLNQLAIAAETASDSELEAVALSGGDIPGISWLRKVSASLRGRRQFTVCNEVPNCFDANFLALQDDTYLVGYWQSHLYFEGISEIVRREFQPVVPWSRRNLELASEISAANAVSVHVRRGDYVDDGSVRAVHGICSPEYYETCMRRMERAIGTPHYYVFSDDPQWARDNIKTSFPKTTVDHNGSGDAVFDIKLMSLCKHNIIANSSFSWWGAWLNTNPEKMIFAPSKWFSRKEARDLLPHSWVSVPS